jgi:hypothetical protein
LSIRPLVQSPISARKKKKKNKKPLPTAEKQKRKKKKLITVTKTLLRKIPRHKKLCFQQQDILRQL